MKPIKLIVIGGGIAGLSAAYYAQKRAIAKNIPLELTVLEADDRWGGKISTDRIENFVIEGGPDTFLAAKPWGVALCKELGLAERLHGANPRQRNTYVLHRNRLEPLPDGLAMMIPGKVGPMITTRLLTWPQKARLGLDFFIPPRANDADETLGGFISRRLGRACYENLIEPLMSGIYAGDGDQLSLLATFPYLRDMERKYHSLAWGAMSMYRRRLRAHRQPGSRSAFLTPITGLAEIVEALVAYLKEHGADLRLKAKTSQLQSWQAATFKPADLPTFQHGWDVILDTEERLQADAVILAAPAYVSGKLLASLDPKLGSVLESIPYVSTATVSLAYRQGDLPRPLDGYGYVIPRREGRRALACTWTSTKFPHRAPDGYALLRIFVGRAGQEGDIAWNDDYLLDIAREELRLTLGITAEPYLTRVFIWERAMPQYNLGHPEKLAQIDAALEALPGLALAGNGYRGIGIPDCIHSGEEAAKKLVRKDIVDALS